MSDAPSMLALLIASISARVRPVVPKMPQAEFDHLVQRMAEAELKYALHTDQEAWRR